MFMFITYPWPVASAHRHLTDYLRLEAPAACAVAAKNTTGQHAPNLEELVGWSGGERLRFQWFRLRFAISTMRRRA